MRTAEERVRAAGVSNALDIAQRRREEAMHREMVGAREAYLAAIDPVARAAEEARVRGIQDEARRRAITVMLDVGHDDGARSLMTDVERAQHNEQTAAAEQAEMQRRAAAGDEQAQAILAAKAEAEAAEKARKAKEAQRLKEAQEMALAERHEGQTTEELAASLGLEVPPPAPEPERIEIGAGDVGEARVR